MQGKLTDQNLQSLYTTVKFDRVPNRNVDNFTRYAILYPMTGRLPMRSSDVDFTLYKALTDKLITEKTFKLIDIWRKRITTLYKSHWPDSLTIDRLTRLFNCYPNFVIVNLDKRPNEKKSVKYCYQEYLCPFCYSRAVQTPYLRLTSLCKQYLKSDSNYQLIGYRITSVIKGTSSKEDKPILIKHIKMTTGARMTRYKLFKGIAGYASLSIEPTATPDWKSTERGVMLMPIDDSVADSLPTETSIWRMKRYKAENLIKLVGNVLRYPTGLLKPKSASKVIKLLEAKGKSRMIASYGLMRNKNA